MLCFVGSSQMKLHWSFVSLILHTQLAVVLAINLLCMSSLFQFAPSAVTNSIFFLPASSGSEYNLRLELHVDVKARRS